MNCNNLPARPQPVSTECMPIKGFTQACYQHNLLKNLSQVKSPAAWTIFYFSVGQKMPFSLIHANYMKFTFWHLEINYMNASIFTALHIVYDYGQKCVEACSFNGNNHPFSHLLLRKCLWTFHIKFLNFLDKFCMDV